MAGADDDDVAHGSRVGAGRHQVAAVIAGSTPKADPIEREEEGAHVGASPKGFSEPDYFALLFSVSIRSLAAGPDEAGFWPVISWPSATV